MRVFLFTSVTKKDAFRQKNKKKAVFFYKKRFLSTDKERRVLTLKIIAT